MLSAVYVLRDARNASSTALVMASVTLALRARLARHASPPA